jgi:N-acyl-D-aspartate/D-glutamate deacylase
LSSPDSSSAGLQATGDAPVYDLVVRRGRVIDPETGLDAVRDIGITGSVITVVSDGPLRGRKVIDAEGLVVSPGFIDLHSHGQAVGECRLQALDGVTTALELEAGAAPVAFAYSQSADEGRPVNFGFSASWSRVRMHVMAGEPLSGWSIGRILAALGGDAWRRPATAGETTKIMDLLERELADGALGIGILLGYAPATDPKEYLRIAAVAASAGVPTFTHARPLVEQDPGVVIDGAEELTRVAAETGAHMHYCHINSTSTRHLERVQSLVDKVRTEGARVTSEAYPYASGMSSIGADYFHPDRLHVLGETGTPSDVIYARTGETVASIERLLELRAADPGGLAFLKAFDEASAPERLARILALPDAAIASDAVPFTVPDGQSFDEMEWPLPAYLKTHPRGAGTYGRTLRIGVREAGSLTLMDAIAKCTLMPARIMESAAPSMKRKGRVQAGCDADLVIFDLERVGDTATYQSPVSPSRGFEHVLVNGQAVVSDGVLDPEALPGRAVRGER